MTPVSCSVPDFSSPSESSSASPCSFLSCAGTSIGCCNSIPGSRRRSNQPGTNGTAGRPVSVCPGFRRLARRLARLAAVGGVLLHLATPVSLIANLLIMPLTGVVVLCGLASLACGAWSAWATECFNHTGWLGMKTMSWISAWMADLPGAWRPVPPPTPLVWLGYYALMLWPLSLQWPRRYRRTLLVGGILSLTAGLLTPVMAAARSTHHHRAAGRGR